MCLSPKYRCGNSAARACRENAAGKGRRGVSVCAVSFMSAAGRTPGLSDHANQNRCDEAERGNDGDKPQLIGEGHATLLGGCDCCMRSQVITAT
jgi:hypothetical protein